MSRELRLDAVSFAFGDTQVLRGASLTVPAGRIVTLFGPSGAGKTTLLDLVIGFYRPDDGEVLIDDTPLVDIDMASWRKEIGYVPQEMFLFHDTVLANVTLGDPRFGRADAEAALRAAEAWEFIATLPDGVDTMVGERGSKFSGGQRQRIAIARALVRKPKLLVLDEPTTALDPESEAAICETLRRLSGSVTIFAISHQPALVDIADIVYSVANGIITEVSEDRPAVRGAR